MSNSQDNIETRTATRNHYSPSSNSVVYIRNDAMVIAALVTGVLGMIFGLTAFSWAYIAEREARIMQGDVTFIRAYLNARGIEVPGSHEDAEAE
jgi:hypothetical protein